MRKTYWHVSLTLLFLALFAFAEASATYATATVTAREPKLGVVSGSVRDHKGNPLAGALVQLLRDGANNVTKQTRTEPLTTPSLRPPPTAA